MYTMDVNGVPWCLDPKEKFTDYTPQQIAQWVGMIPSFFDMEEGATLEEIKEHMSGRYGFPLCDMKGGTIREDLSYDYPEDSLLYPLTIAAYGDTVVLVYEYGMVALFDRATRTHYMTRMD